MKKTGKWLLMLVLCVAMCLGLCACGNKQASEDEYADGDTIEIVLWATYGAKGQGYLTQLVEEFNSMQEDYYVQIYNNGSAADIRTKLEAADPSNYPSLFCGQPLVIGLYDGVDYVKPIQEFIDADEEDWTAGLYENVRSSYSDKDGNMLGWPLGVSCSGYFVNVDVLKQAGYTMEDLTSYEKIVEAALAITDKGLCKYGISFLGTGVELIDMLTIQGLQFVDADNGYSGEVTKTVLMEGENYKGMEKVAKLTASLYEKECAMPYGTDVGGEAFPLFNSGELGIVYATNSWTHYVTYGEPEFEYAFIPSVGIDDSAKYAGNVISEGTGLFIANTGNEKEMQGAYEFLKFLSEPEKQATWCTCLGYVPYTDEAAATQVWKDWMAETLPSAQNVIDKIKNSSAEVRTPYIEFSNKGVGIDLFNNVSIEPKGDMKKHIENAMYDFDEALDIWKARQ